MTEIPVEVPRRVPTTAERVRPPFTDNRRILVLVSFIGLPFFFPIFRPHRHHRQKNLVTTIILFYHIICQQSITSICLPFPFPQQLRSLADISPNISAGDFADVFSRRFPETLMTSSSVISYIRFSFQFPPLLVKPTIGVRNRDVILGSSSSNAPMIMMTYFCRYLHVRTDDVTFPPFPSSESDPPLVQ